MSHAVINRLHKSGGLVTVAAGYTPHGSSAKAVSLQVYAGSAVARRWTFPLTHDFTVASTPRSNRPAGFRVHAALSKHYARSQEAHISRKGKHLSGYL
jgi:hypothetical protein